MKSSSSSFLLRPKMLLMTEAALEGALVGTFDGSFDGEGDDSRSLRLLWPRSVCEVCDDLDLERLEWCEYSLPALLLFSAKSGTKDETKELGAALGATLRALYSDTTLCGFEGFGGLAVDADATLSVLAIDTVLLAFSIISNSGFAVYGLAVETVLLAFSIINISGVVDER
jgi:hypothetical protein